MSDASTTFISPSSIRAAFAAAMSRMYREEVPLYGNLVDIVRDVNETVLRKDSSASAPAERARLQAERHGAIRVGTARELSLLRRVFAVMGMEPVGYYDLAVANVPVHSTAFRPITLETLNANPFRVFTSLLRLDLLEDDSLRERAREILESRSILSDAALQLVETAEREGGLTQAQADAFVVEVLETFRWRSEALVDAQTYESLHDEHRLVADVVCFRGPHINHLTPRVLDIDAAQQAMLRQGIDAKSVIEGPPRRAVPILLRQTSFKALEESIHFVGDEAIERGTHTARFGEIEQRGAALTRRGRQLYDACLAEARADNGAQGPGYDERLSKAFKAFPDYHQAMRLDGLVFYRYDLTDAGRAASAAKQGRHASLEELVVAGWVAATPIVYEDFLPVSAAGIFQSNLGGAERGVSEARSSQEAFEHALGARVHDPFALYEVEEAHSIDEVLLMFHQRPKAQSA